MIFIQGLNIIWVGFWMLDMDGCSLDTVLTLFAKFDLIKWYETK